MNKKYNKSESKGGAHIVRLYCMLLLEADNIDRINIRIRIIIPTWLLGTGGLVTVYCMLLLKGQ